MEKNLSIGQKPGRGKQELQKRESCHPFAYPRGSKNTLRNRCQPCNAFLQIIATAVAGRAATLRGLVGSVCGPKDRRDLLGAGNRWRKNRHRKALFSSLAEQGLQWYLESLADDSVAVLIGRDEDQGRLNQEGKKGVTAIIFSAVTQNCPVA